MAENEINSKQQVPANKQKTTSKKQETNSNNSTEVQIKQSDTDNKKTTPKKSGKSNDVILELDTIKSAWPGIMKAVKPHNHSLEALLRATEPEDCMEQTVTLKVYYAFHKEQLEQERHRRILEEVFSSELGGSPVRLEFVLGSRNGASKSKQDEAVNVTGNVEDEDLATAAEEIFGKSN